MRVVDNFRGSIVSARRKRTERSPEYHASVKAMQLLAEMEKSGEAVERFLTDIAADTKLPDTGEHKRLARDVLIRSFA